MNRVATRRPGRAEAAARGPASPRRRGSDAAAAEASSGDVATLDSTAPASAAESVAAEAWPRYLGAEGPGDVMLLPQPAETPAEAPAAAPAAPGGGPQGPVEAPATAGGSPVQAAIAPGLLPPDSVDADPAARRARETPLPAQIEVPALKLMQRDQASLQGDVQQATHAIDPNASELTAGRHADGAAPVPPRLDDADTPAGDTPDASTAAAPGDAEGEGAPAPDAAAPEAQAGGGAGGPRASAGGGLLLALDAEEVPLDEPLEAALATMDSTELEVPHEIDVPTLAAQWGAAAELGDDVLPQPDKAGRRGQAPPKPGADKDDKKGDTPPAGKAKPDSPRPSDREQDAEVLAAARSRAQRAWADLSSAARSRQQGFVDESNRVAAYLGHAYANIADRIESAHDQGIDQLTLSADQACEEIGRVSSSAEMALDQSATDTLVAIQAAAGSAWGAISANEASAGTQIDSIVGGLVAGHQGAFNGVIDKTKKAIEDAVKALSDWSAERTTNYSLNDSSKLEGAKNEKRQQRIPRLVEDETKSLNERKTSKIDNWSQTRDTTVCGLSCGYRAPLEAHRTAMHTTGRQSVGKALRSARKTLSQQVRDTRGALHQMRGSAVSQIRTQQRSTAGQLTAQARAALQNARRESQGAVGGVGGAARSALPGYWRATQGLEQTLRRAGTQGGPAIDKVARTAPEGILRGLARTTESLQERLAGNRDRLDTSLIRQAGTLAEGRETQLAQARETFATLTRDTTLQLDTSVSGMGEACSSLADSVTQAAASWAEPLATHFAGFIAEKQGEAQAALTSLLEGGGPPAGGGAAPAAPAAAPGGAAAPGADSCGGCSTQAANNGGGGGAGAAPAGGGGAGGGSAAPTGLRAQGDEEVTYAGLRANPAQFFATPLADAGSSVESDLTRRAGDVSSALEAGVIDTVNEAGVTGALRGMTKAKGQALDLEVYGRNQNGRTLSADLLDKMGSGADYNAAVAYLAGNNVLGARYELDASVHWYNDEESRIEATMRALSPEDLAALGQADPALLNRVEGALDGTDQQVFQALRTGNYARADAYRLRDRIDEARRDGNSDAVHTAIAESTAATSSGWGGRELTAEERRAAVVRELGEVVGDQAGTPTTAADGTPLTADQINTERAAAYVTRDIEVYDPNSESTRTLSITGANRDLAVALLRHGEGSVEARAARLGVEMQRTGDPPSALNIDRAMFDERFTPDNPHATREEIEANERRRQAARAERAQALLLAAQSYGGVAAPGDGSAAATTAATATTNADGTPRNPLSDPGVTAARDALIAQMGARFGDDDLGRRLSAGLMTDERPSAQTASLAMQHAMYSHAGTNEELLWRFTERMTRDEVQAMRNQFRADTGRSLDAELGVYGQGGTFTELSGDDRLRMERAMLGVARDDRERAEAAAFAIQQQRQETGSFGSWLAEGSMAESAMNATDARLRNMAGGSFDFSAESLMSGRPLLTGGNFDPTTGRYTGTGDRSSFLATTESAQQVAQNYASRIDAYANVATTGIAILGAIAAAVITVVTGGAAGPLVAAAVIAGLASMGANYAIKGGRYGWEQAAVDLGMTAVQAVTAGVGAQLGAAAQVASKGAAAAAQASRTVVALSRIFGANPIVNQIMVGAITGAIGGLGNAALQEQTWEHGGAGAIGALFEGLARGMLSGAVTSAATQGLESLGGLGQRLQALSTEPGGLRAVMNMVTRGAGRAFISGTAGMAAKASEVGFDALAHPNRHVDAGDALMEIGQAGLHAALQALGEGAGEAVATGRRAPTVHAAGEAINAERARRGLPALEGPDLHAAAEDLLFLATHGRDRRDTAGHLDPIAGHGSLEAASKAMAGGTPAAPPRRPAHAEADEEGAAPRRSADEADPATRTAPADEPGAAAPRPAAEGDAAHPAAPARPAGEGDAPAPARPAGHADADPAAARPAAPAAEPAAEPAAAPHAADAPEAASRRSQRVADDEASFADAEFDALIREVRNSEFGYELEAAKRRGPADLAEDTAHTRRQVDDIAHRDARALAGAGPAGTQVQHWTKTLDVTRNLPAGMNPLHPGVINENLSHLQSRRNLPGTELHVDPAGGGTRFYIDEVPRGRVGDAGMPGEQLDLFTPSRGPRAADYNTEHKFADAHLIPAAAEHITAARRRAGLPELDPRMLAIAAGEMARWQMTGHSGSERSGRMLDLAAAASARPAAHATESTPARVSPQGELDFSAPPPARVRVDVSEPAAGPASARPAAPEEGAAPRLRVATGDDADLQAHHEAAAADAEAPAPLRRMALPEREGAAAAISGSGMRLADAPVITQPRAAMHAALAEAGGVSSLAGRMHVDPNPTADGHVAVHLENAEGRPLRVKVVVAETEGGDVASFRRPGAGEEGFDYVVHLSPRAPHDTHARAMAHELAELRVHGTAGTPSHDALRPGEGTRVGARLSAHDRGRLAELEVLSRRAATMPEGEARTRTLVEIEALAGHLGLLHGDDANPRLALARDAIAADSPAHQQLREARARAARDSEADQLGPARRVDPDAPLSAADRRRVAELEDISAQLARIEEARARPGRRSVSAEEMAEQARHEAGLQRRMQDLMERMGLGGPLHHATETDLGGSPVRRTTEAGERMQRVLAVLGEDSPAAARLRGLHNERDTGLNDALRPGLQPDARTRLSEADQRNLAALSTKLQELEAAIHSLPAHDAANEPPHIRRLRHEAESAAASLGLVHGKHAAARLDLAARNLPGGDALRTRLNEVAAGGKVNPLLLPLTASPGDVPLLVRQARAAMAIGDTALAGQLMQIAGLHLANSGLHGTTLAERLPAARLMREVSHPADRAMLADVVARQRELARAPALRSEADALQRRLDGMRGGRHADEPAQRQRMAEVEARIARLRSDADTAERVALRPAQMDADAARRFAGSAEEMGVMRRVTSVMEGFDMATQVRLVTQLYGDSPQFQSWGRAQLVYAEFFRSTEAVGFRMDADGSFPAAMRDRIASRDGLFERWAGGHYVSEETGRPNQLDDLEFIASRPGGQVWGEESSGPRVHLADDAEIQVRQREADGTISRDKGEPVMEQRSVRQALDERAQLMRDNEALRAATPRDEALIQRNQERIVDLSEALGEAAGRRYAESLALEGETHVGRGAGVPDVVHVVGNPGDADFRVTVIECKGGNAELGSRRGTQGGRPVRAEQTTPEYLRSLANEMIRNNRDPELARQILAALDQGPPAIQVVVVRQGAVGNTASAIEVTNYPVTRDGH